MLALTEIFHDDQEHVSQRGNLTASAKKEKVMQIVITTTTTTTPQ